MTDAEYAAQRARVKAILDAWRVDMGLGPWRLKINYERRRSTVSQGEDWETVQFADVSADWRYAQAVFYVYLESCATLDDEELEERLVHEFCHCLVAELRDTEHGCDPEFMAHEEHVATTMARAFIAVRDRAREEASHAEREIHGPRREGRENQEPGQAAGDGPGGVCAGQPERGQGIHARGEGQRQALSVLPASSARDDLTPAEVANYALRVLASE